MSPTVNSERAAGESPGTVEKCAALIAASAAAGVTPAEVPVLVRAIILTPGLAVTVSIIK